MKTERNPLTQLAIAAAFLPAGSLMGAAAPPIGEGAPAAVVAPKPSPWTVKASLAAKESFDSNVYLQDKPDGAPGLSEKTSFVTTLTPAIGLSYKPCAEFSADVSYAPDLVWYASEPTEDHVAHRGKLGFNGKVGSVDWNISNTLLLIDGSDLGLIWDGVGGAPAAGGIPVRNRRDALVYVAGVNAQIPISQFFVRPVFSYYIHDFQTQQLNLPGYLNYVDRDDINAGADLGMKVMDKTFVTLGYRYGHQDQDTLAWSPVEYSNDYQRVLLGLEGQPWSWMKLSASAGPDFRQYGDNVAWTFPSSDTVLHADAGVTLIPGKSDTFSLKAKQYQQPSFGGRSVYDDKTFSIDWRHQFDAAWTVGAGFQAYNTDFIDAGNRDDWIFTPSAMLSWRINKPMTAELSYTYDWSYSSVPDQPAREFTRHVVNLGLRFAFQ